MQALEQVIPHYQGIAWANLAWVAWRQGKFSEAQRHGQAALKVWQTEPLAPGTFFQWIALWPLLAIELAQNHLANAVHYARSLLVPEQQPLPMTLRTALEEAIQIWDANRPEAARMHLNEAMTVAQEMGYL